jgi:Ser/Thr protein kinase RdoA (MazF antagonist)
MHYAKISNTEKESVKKALSFYDISYDKESIIRNTIGFVNKIYVIGGEQKYVLRESNPLTDRRHLRLEVEILCYLSRKKFALSPQIIANISGAFITTIDGKYYILQTFVEGDPQANWDDLKNFNDKMLVSHFKSLAVFSKVISKFKYKHRFRNLTLSYYARNGVKFFKAELAKIPKSRGRTLLEKSSKDILNFIKDTKREFALAGYDKLPKQIVHFDYHPGNSHFNNDSVVGIFDFDWARFDSPVADIAATICQSCYYPEGPNAGIYRKDKIQLGLKAYRDAYNAKKGELLDNSLIKIALKAYLLYTLFYTMEWYATHCKRHKHFKVLELFINAIMLNDFNELFS